MTFLDRRLLLISFAHFHSRPQSRSSSSPIFQGQRISVGGCVFHGVDGTGTVLDHGVVVALFAEK